MQGLVGRFVRLGGARGPAQQTGRISKMRDLGNASADSGRATLPLWLQVGDDSTHTPIGLLGQWGDQR